MSSDAETSHSVFIDLTEAVSSRPTSSSEALSSNDSEEDCCIVITDDEKRYASTSKCIGPRWLKICVYSYLVAVCLSFNLYYSLDVKQENAEHSDGGQSDLGLLSMAVDEKLFSDSDSDEENWGSPNSDLENKRCVCVCVCVRACVI